MIGENIAEEIDCGNFFDNIEDLLEDLDHDVDFNTNSAAFPPIWSEHSDSLPSDPVVDPVLFSVNTAPDSALSPDLCVPVSSHFNFNTSFSNFVKIKLSIFSLTYQFSIFEYNCRYLRLGEYNIKFKI